MRGQAHDFAPHRALHGKRGVPGLPRPRRGHGGVDIFFARRLRAAFMRGQAAPAHVHGHARALRLVLRSIRDAVRRPGQVPRRAPRPGWGKGGRVRVYELVHLRVHPCVGGPRHRLAAPHERRAGPVRPHLHRAAAASRLYPLCDYLGRHLLPRVQVLHHSHVGGLQLRHRRHLPGPVPVGARRLRRRGCPERDAERDADVEVPRGPAAAATAPRRGAHALRRHGNRLVRLQRRGEFDDDADFVLCRAGVGQAQRKRVVLRAMRRSGEARRRHARFTPRAAVAALRRRAKRRRRARAEFLPGDAKVVRDAPVLRPPQVLRAAGGDVHLDALYADVAGFREAAFGLLAAAARARLRVRQPPAPARREQRVARGGVRLRRPRRIGVRLARGHGGELCSA
mmetsp:Transcript_3113/g.11149  ORF Transcript_3113/g.11149 Transcript_3113/m.11149 type:complete len:397 (-) Transcript_3113:179-1369(-)